MSDEKTLPSETETGDAELATSPTVTNPAVVDSTRQVNPHALMELAIQNKAPIEHVERLVALIERREAAFAEQEFNAAMSAFQSQIPVIEKKHEVRNKAGGLIYRHANNDDITRAIKSIESDNGLHHTFKFNKLDTGGCDTTCIVTHVGGHKESTTVTIPATKGMNTNSAQDYGIVMQYGMRYSLCGAYGITTSDEDTDGRGGETVETINDAQVKVLRATLVKINEAGGDGQAVEEVLCTRAKIDSISELQQAHFSSACAMLNKKLNEAEAK